jgi:hypothetical protein
MSLLAKEQDLENTRVRCYARDFGFQANGMRILFVLWCEAGFACAAFAGSTNDWPKGGPGFAMHVQLRMPVAAPKPTAPEGSLADGRGPRLDAVSARTDDVPRSSRSQLSAVSEPALLSGHRQDHELEVFHRLDRAGFFERPQRPSDSAVVRWAEGTFQPEVLGVGKTKVTCSLLTAIKRKNPLCLVNPLFLNVSW